MNDKVMDDLRQQVGFLLEIDKLKSIERRTILLDHSRNENSAEHSWQVALCAYVLAPYAVGDVDINRVIRMLLVHDIVEIDAGDTFAYDNVGKLDQREREAIASARLFGMLPEIQKQELLGLFDEFDAQETDDSRFANAVDRLMPLLHNSYTEGHTWKLHRITRAQVLERMAIILQGAPDLWSYVTELVDDAVDQGYLLP